MVETPKKAADLAVLEPSLRFVGLDVHKRQITAVILDAQGKKLATRTFELTGHRLETFARVTLRPTDRVALEATTNCWAVTRVLEPHVAEVVVSNPLATKAIALAKVKTDKVDAQVLAQLLRCGYLPSVWHPDPATRRLRELTGRRAGLVSQRTALRNRIHSVLAVRLIECPSDLFGKSGQEWLSALLDSSDRIDADGAWLIRSDLALLQALDQEQEALQRQLVQFAWEREQVKLLMTLPGVDVTVALSLLAALGDVTRFSTPEQLASYLGLVPSTRQSAAKCYHGPITKQGNSQARWMLIQAAQHVARHPGPLGHFMRRLKNRKNHNVAVVATARKLAMIAWHMLKNREPYRYAQPKTTQTKLARLRVEATGQKRRGGVAKGEKAQAKSQHAGGSREVKSLDRVYAEESLPARQEPAVGEKKMLQRSKMEAWAHSLGEDRRVPRSAGQKDESPRNQCSEKEVTTS